MSNWLQKRLVIWFGVSLCGGASVWNVGTLQAQGGRKSSRPKLARDEAAKNFVVKLSTGGLSRYSFISMKSELELGDQTSTLLMTMETQWRQFGKTILKQTVRVKSEGERTATVIVETIQAPLARPLVLIEEDGGWGVDLIETYAKWNNLQGVAKAKAIYKITGIILDDLPRTEEFARGACQTNLKQIALGIAQYSQDYDEKYPLAKPWIDALQPYVKTEQLFNCPALPKSRRYGYAFNSKLSNKMEMQISNTSKTITIYETSVLKRNAYGMGENLAFRHQGGANYMFANGHVKWVSKPQIPSFKLNP